MRRIQGQAQARWSLQGIAVGLFSVMFWWCQYVLLLVEAGPLDLNCDPCVNRSKLEVHAVVHGTLDDPFWEQTEKAMQQAARDMGIDFHMDLWETFASQAMADEIRSLIRYELDDSPHGHNHDVKQIDALIVTMPDATVRAAVDDAIHAGIHVFGLNLGYQYAEEMGLLGYVAQNEYLAGAMAAREFERRRLDAYGNAQRALFINHDENDPSLRERFRGFNDTLAAYQIVCDQMFVDPNEEYIMVVEIHDIIEPCIYDYVLLGGSETVKPAAASFAHHSCDTYLDDIEKDVPDMNDTIPERMLIHETANATKGGPMMLAAFDGTEAVFHAIIEEHVEFALTQENYLQGALPVVLATLYASTGQRLSLPNDRPVYNSGPHIVDINSVPSDTHLDCKAEAFPVCGSGGETFTVGECPCIDRSRITIAGVIHGVTGSNFWNTVIDAAEQAALDMDVEFELTQFAQQENDAILHKKMASKIVSLCGSGISAIFVTMPSEEVRDAVRFCKQLRIPVVNINSGYRFAVELGVQHIGQLEYVAGMEAGDRMVLAGVQEGYCLTPEPDNVALQERCEGFQDALLQANKTFGGVVEVPRDNQALYTKNVEDAVGSSQGNWRGIALLVNGDIEQALGVQRNHQSVALGTFDVRENLFEPLNDGRLLFTMDQQQYMQGSMSVYLLAYAAFAGQTLINNAIETGPMLMEYAPDAAGQFCVENNYEVCSQIPEENYNYISDTLLIVGYAAVGVVGATGVFCLLWMQCYKDKNIVKASQPLFLGLLVLGAVISALSILPQGVQTAYRYLQDPMTGELTDEPNPDIQFVDVACMVTPWLYGVGFSVMFSALCAKIHRVKMIYAAGLRMRRVEVGVIDVIAVMGIMLAIEVTILLVWTLMYPSQWEREVTEEVDGYVLQSVGRCNSEHHQTFTLSQLCFHAACLLYAVLLCWQTSEIPTEFAEGSYISLSVLCIFQVAVLSIPIAYMVEDTPDVYYFVKAISIFLQAFTVLSLIFFPKMWRVATGNDELPLPTARRTTARGSSAPTFRSDQGSAPSVVALAPKQSSTNKPTSTMPSQSSQPTIDESLRMARGNSNSNMNAKSYSKNNGVFGESAPVAQMAPLDSDSEDENQEEFAANAMAAVTVAGARNHLRAALDDDSSTSSVKDLSNSGAQIVGANNELADLAAEVSRVEQAREGVYSSTVGEPSSSGNRAANASTRNDGQPNSKFKRRGSPDVDSSVSTSSSSVSLGPGAAQGPLVLSRMPGRKKKRYRNYGEAGDPQSPEEAKVGTSQLANLPAVHEPQHETNPQEGYEKNPQEGSLGSRENSNHNHKKGVAAHPTESQSTSNRMQEEGDHQHESESTSTIADTTGFSKADASKAEIFRKPGPPPPSTPIRLKKDPKAYGDNATLALGITKARGSFLRKVAASYGSNSMSSSSTQKAASLSSKSTSLDVTPTRPSPKKPSPLKDLQGPPDKNLEFNVDRQSRPAYAALKKINSTDEEELGAKIPASKKVVGEGGAFYFL